MKGKQVCKNHGGKSTGPKTPEGRKRCAEAKTIHGRETRLIRNERSKGLARLALLEALGRKVGLIAGEKTRGTKPKKFTGLFD